MYNLCKYIPKEQYWVITASGRFGARAVYQGKDLGFYDSEYSLDCNATRLPLKSNRLIARIVYIFLSVVNGFLLNLRKRFDCLLAVYPDESDMYAATILQFLLRVPLVIYMHDLYSEVRKRERAYGVWRLLEDAVFARSSMIIVTNDKFRNYYLDRGLDNVEVLPSCVDCDKYVNQVASETNEPSDKKLKIVYTGSIYGANEDAIQCFLRAAEKVSQIELIFCTPYRKKYLEGVNVGFLNKAKCRALQESADVLLLPLAFCSPYPQEIRIAFPCKALEYLAAERPILAIVPAGSYVEEFVKKHDVGIVVNTASEEKVIEALEKLKIPAVRKRFSQNAHKAVCLYDAKVQAQNLMILAKKVVAENWSLAHSKTMHMSKTAKRPER
jgi:glycosyltransferase involved in cell wall biosynthesis